MIEHFDCQLGVHDEDDFIAIGLGGMASGQRSDAIFQWGKNHDEQDRAHGMDKLYCEYDQLGEYGIVNQVQIKSGKTVRILLNEEAAKIGIPDTELVFYFDEKIDHRAIEMLKLICSNSGTDFQVE